MPDVWTMLYDELQNKLTKKELRVLNDLMEQKGSLEDVVIEVLKKSLDPDLLSISDIELCMQKAMKIGAYAMGMSDMVKSKSSQPDPYEIAREVALEAEKQGQAQASSPFQDMMRQISNAIAQSIQAEVMAKLQNILPNNIQQSIIPNYEIKEDESKNTKKNNEDNTNLFLGDT